MKYQVQTSCTLDYVPIEENILATEVKKMENTYFYKVGRSLINYRTVSELHIKKGGGCNFLNEKAGSPSKNVSNEVILIS